MRIRIEGTDLPGNACSPDGTTTYVGVQRRGRPGEILDPHPGDAESAHWNLECATRPVPGGVDVTGPYVQGRPGERFVYLSWGTVSGDGVFTMFRRAKLMLGAIDPGVLGEAVREGRLTARVRLTDATGRPICAQVRPPYIEWSA